MTLLNRKNAFIVTQSIKKLKADERTWALNKCDFKNLYDDTNTDISNLPYDDKGIYYKEIPYTPRELHQMLIVVYSPKYARYQKTIREKQIERAKCMLSDGTAKRTSKNPNDPRRFIKKIAVTNDGEIANIHDLLDNEKIENEALYDGFVECELMPVMLAYCRIEYLGLMDIQVFVEHGEPERVDDGQAEYFASAADEYLWRSRA